MAKASFTQSAFLGGEWSQTAQGYINDPKYKVALSLCLNYIPGAAGELYRRSGTETACPTYAGLPGRVVQFDIKDAVPTMMEFTNFNVRFITGTKLNTTNDQQTVSSISTANPAKVTTGTHGWATGDQVQFNALGTVDPILLSRQFTITVTSSTAFTIASTLTGTGIDGSTLQSFTSGTIVRLARVGSPYSDLLWPTLRSVQAELQSVLLQASVTPQVITATVASGLDTTFALTPAQFKDGPYLNPVVGGIITPAATSGSVGFTITSPTYSATLSYNQGDFVIYSGTCYQSLLNLNVGNEPDSATFAWAVVTQDKIMGPNGLQTTDIGRHIRLFSEPAAWASGTTYAANANVKYNSQYWTALVGSNTGNIPGIDVTKWKIATNAAIWTWGIITSLTGAVATIIPAATDLAGATGSSNVNAKANAFDGNTNAKALFQGAYDSSSPTETWLGKHFSSGAQSLSYAIVQAPSNSPFASKLGGVNPPGQVILNLRGKSTAPASGSDGTLLGSVTAANVAGEQVQIFSNDSSTTFNYLWIEITIQNPPGQVGISQISFYTTSPFSGTGITAQILGPTLLYTTAINTWRLGLFTAATGYPTCGTYHEGRLWLSGLVDNRLDAGALTDIYGNSAQNIFTFSPTLFDGTVTASCAISYTLEAPGVNSTYWMEPDLQGIVVGTQAGEWLVQATTVGQPLSPLNMQAHRQTKIQCANILPRRTEHTIVAVQKHARSIMEFFADIFSGKFSAPNLADKAKHLTVTGLKEIAYTQELDPIVWARRGDGRLVGMTYKRDTLMTSQGPTMNAWHQHTLGTGRTVESVTQTGTADGTLPTLGMVTSDGTYRYVEVMTPKFEEGSALTTAWFLDGAQATTSTAPLAYATGTVGPAPGIIISGLWHMNGLTVTVFAGGLDVGDVLVSGGAAGVAFAPTGTQTNASFTSAFVSAFNGAMPIVVGKTYTSQAQLVRPDTMEGGARNGPGAAKSRKLNKFGAYLVNAWGLSFGTKFANLRAATFKTTGGTALANGQMFSGVQKDVINDDAEGLAGQLCFQQTRPFPATIGSITGFIQTEDE